MLELLQRELSSRAIERDAEVNAILLGLIAREHVLFVGPPGVGKSYVCRLASESINGLRYCERLLSPTSPPESIFGPLSLKALREDRREHCGTGYVQESHFVFLDEVFRGSDAIRDTLLHVLGPERQALIGSQQVQVPLISCVGASNSWTDSADQSAFLDRWLIRRTVRPLSDSGLDQLTFNDLPTHNYSAALDELSTATNEARLLAIPEATREAFREIRTQLSANGIHPSDRRVKLSVKVARAQAILDGASEVLPRHLEPLSDVLWDNPNEQPGRAADIIIPIANPTGAKITEILREVDGIVSAATDTPTKLEAIKKLEDCEKRAKKLTTEGNGRAAKAHEYVRHEKLKLHASAMGISIERMEEVLKGVK